MDAINRRTFLKAGALGACATTLPAMARADEGEVTASSFEIAPDPIADADITQTYQAEIVVVGGGLSGMCTACSACMAGADVIVVQAGSIPGGRGGSQHAINSSYQKEHGVDYTEQDAAHLAQLVKTMYVGQVDERKWARWINNSAESIDWMCEIMNRHGLNTSLGFGATDPDGYYTSKPSNLAFWTEDRVVGEINGAPEQSAAYAEEIESLGGRIFYNTVAEQLVREDEGAGRVSAVVAKDASGSYVRFEASKAVVLATGDFSKDREMMAKYAPRTYEMFKDSIDWETVDYDKGMVTGGLFPGQGHKMGLWAGAAWQRVYPCADMVFIMSGGFPHPSDGMSVFRGIFLDINGKRFMNENTNHAFLCNALMARPEKKIFFVWDTAYVDNNPWTLEPFGMTVDNVNGMEFKTREDVIAGWDNAVGATLVKADTLEELLGQYEGMDVETAVQSISNWNGYCEAGYDAEFQDNPELLKPIATPPFYACCIDESRLSLLTVLGGLRTNEKLQVCDADDNPIEGLYCTGTMIGDFYATTYAWSIYGQNEGATCCTLSYLLGRDLAALA